MRSEGYSTWVCVSVCLSVESDLTYGVSVRPENAVTYSAGNGSQNICGIFSETAPLQRSSTPSVDGHTYSRPFSLRNTCMRVIVLNHVLWNEATISSCLAVSVNSHRHRSVVSVSRRLVVSVRCRLWPFLSIVSLAALSVVVSGHLRQPSLLGRLHQSSLAVSNHLCQPSSLAASVNRLSDCLCQPS